jgi:hypothetical protein
MKLNPPASSSDLETARQIARRLHQSRRRDDRPASSAEEDTARPRLNPPPLPLRPAPPDPLVRTESRPAPRSAPLPAPEMEPEEVEVDAEAAFAPAAPAFEAWREAEPSPAAKAPLGKIEPEPDMTDVDVEVSSLSSEQILGETSVDADDSPLDGLTETEASPFDEELLDAPPLAEESPSWDEVVENCRNLGQAQGAMLVDPTGEVFSTRGDWPAPGPEPIAAKLVAMMSKTLKDAPTRSISAPLMGLHLTAWRVPLNEGLVTVAFIGAAPVRADARPAIDAAILSGPDA